MNVFTLDDRESIVPLQQHAMFGLGRRGEQTGESNGQGQNQSQMHSTFSRNEWVMVNE